MRIVLIVSLLFGLTACFNKPNELTASKNKQLSVAALVNARFTSSGEKLVLLSMDEIALWQTDNQRALARLKLQATQAVKRHLAVSEHANILLVADNKSAYLYQLDTLNLVSQWPVAGFSPLAQITTLQVSDDGKHFFVGLNEGSLVWVNLHTQTQSIYKVHDADITFIFENLIENQIITASHDGTIYSLNSLSGDMTKRIQASSRITSLDLSKDKQLLFYSDALSQQKVINTNNWQAVSFLNYLARFKHFRASLFINNQTLVTASPKSEFSIWQLPEGKRSAIGHIRAHSMGSKVVDFTTDKLGNLITISSDGELQTWQI